MRALAALVLAAACGSSPPPPVISTPLPVDAAPVDVGTVDVVSHDILARDESTGPSLVRHILVGWKELAPTYHDQMDPRAARRTQAEAAALAAQLRAQLVADPSRLAALIEQHSEDPGSKQEPYEVEDDTTFVPEFKALALRLNLGEAGIVETKFGYHVIVRVPPPPPDPLESAEILARPASSAPVLVQHVLISWDQTTRSTSTRTKAEADALATQILDEVRAGRDIVALIQQHSDEPVSKDNGRPLEIEPRSPMVRQFVALSLRLGVGEAGLVKTTFGWHVIKRIPPPPPDKLESTKILARTPVTETAKVKHILLGYKDLHADDERGKTRTRTQLDKLVKATVARHARGTKFEALMAELSEDPGSAASGEAYEVTPDTGLVRPFKELSLRLNVGEVGVVKTMFGFHIILRVE